MKKTILTIFIGLGVFYLQAQQYQLFTNYVLNDFGFNPAIAGTTSEYIDVRATYRTQWTGIEEAPTTTIASAHGLFKKIPIGLGGYVYNDVAGQIERTGAALALSYRQKLGFGNINIGISGGYFNLSLSDSYFAEENADPTLLAAQGNQWTPDFSAGVYLQTNSGLFIGLSVPQILEQKVNFSNDQNSNTSNLIPHYYGMAGYRLKLNEKITLEPSILVKFTEAVPLQIDGSLRAFFNEKFWVGGSYRMNAAATGMIGYDLNQLIGLAYAYDFTTNELNAASEGSHEISLSLRLGKKKDTDEDGVADHKDECPEEPGLAENKGCPEEEIDIIEAAKELLDSDQDGILDLKDKCPNEKGPKDNHGCPYGDRDKDGIRDEIDDCPDVAGLAGHKGCPQDDQDGDGILDIKDKCPNEAGALINEGCPEADTDGDGIINALDNCPNTPGLESEKGCPKVGIAERELLDLVIQNVYFDTDKDKIKREAYPYLDRLAEFLVKNKDWKVGMTGHADARGKNEHNQDLSKRRVESVTFYLMNRGVSRSQLETDYYGENVPAAPNDPETYYLNRRVEMKFLWD